MRRGMALLSAALPLLLTGCGSTVPGAAGAGSTTGALAGGASVGGGLGAGVSPGDAAASSTGGDSEAPADGSSTGAPGGAVHGTAPAGAVPGARGGGSAGAGTVPGLTATEIRVGVGYLANGSQGAKSAGIDLDRGEEKKYWQAAIDEANAHGGVAGRKLVPVFYALDAQSTQTLATQEQAECTAFTQDKRVFAVLSSGSVDFTACLSRAGVLHATTGSYVGFDRDFYRRYPTYFAQRPSQHRLQADLVSALVRQSYFAAWDTFRGAAAPTGKATVGVLAVDYPYITRTVEQVLLPALAKAGHPVDPSAVYHAPVTPSVQEAGPGSAAVQSAVLGFRQKGVTHVIVLDVNGSTTLLFAQQSSNQGYYPRMGVTSASGIQQLYDLGVVQARQVNGALGLGWTPTLDLPKGQAGKYLSSAATRCRDLMRRKGVATDSTTAEGLAMFSCDAVFTFASATSGAGRALNVMSAIRAYEAAGSSLVSATVGRLFFSPSHHDGLGVAYDMAWDGGCSCVRYRDAGHRMP